MAESGRIEHLEMDADPALFAGRLHGVVATFYENERPLQGLAGLLDWRFQGALSAYLRQGAVSGKAGECVYVPVAKNGRLFHLILVGGGRAPDWGTRNALTEESLAPLRKNLQSLKLDRMGVSRKDFGGGEDTWFNRAFKGVSFCLVN